MPAPAPLRAPFPYFGGKRRCAHLVWERFGDVPNYVEPFFGSGAVLLGRPHAARTETVNDLDCFIANFWRAVTADPAAVAAVCDWPVNEADLHARHRWLVDQVAFRERMKTDPDFFDVAVAGRWVWGISQWIGSGWCSRPEWVGRTLPGRASRGVHGGKIANSQWSIAEQMPDLGGNSGATGKGVVASGLHRKRVNLKRGGLGIHGELKIANSQSPIAKPLRQLPVLSGHSRGVQSRNATSRMGQWNTRPFLTRPGGGVHASDIRENLVDYMLALRDRLRRVRVCCGDWERVLGRSPTECIGVTGIFLDPPYGEAAGRDASIYNHDDLGIAPRVAKWAVAHGDNPLLRIAFCGYEGEHVFPKNWPCIAWKANGGYGNQAKGRGSDNAKRERIWFSPSCLVPQKDWFA